MAAQHELDGVYLATARAHAAISKAVRAKVGCAIVTPSGAILGGYNGTPRGHSSNVAEWEMPDGTLKTKDCVIHAEKNAIAAAAREGVSLLGSTCYVTLSPCMTCATLIHAAGIKRLVYETEYRDTSAVDLLKELGVEVQQLNVLTDSEPN
jgi:dCMP deaminase